MAWHGNRVSDKVATVFAKNVRSEEARILLIAPASERKELEAEQKRLDKYGDLESFWFDPAAIDSEAKFEKAPNTATGLWVQTSHSEQQVRHCVIDRKIIQGTVAAEPVNGYQNSHTESRRHRVFVRDFSLCLCGSV